MSYPQSLSSKSVSFGSRFSSLDGLRGLAVLSVVLFHALRIKGDFGIPGAIWVRFHGSAWAGVDLFFVLSGFLITGILLDSRGQHHYFRNFYARRTLRIFPLYYLVLAIALFVAPIVIGLHRLPAIYPRLIEHQIWLWTYTQNYLQATMAHTLPGFGHFWSLAVEEQFYWFWPIAVLLLSRKRLLQLCLFLCVVLPFVRLTLVLSGERLWAVRQYTHTRFDTLLYGAIVAIVVRDSRLLQKFRRPAIVAAAVACAILAAIAIQDGFVPYESVETAFAGYSAFAIVFAVLTGYLVTVKSRVSDLLSAKSLSWFGAYSYGIYVFHWPITQACQAALDPRLARRTPALIGAIISFSTVLIASSCAAYGSFVLYESRWLKLKKYFKYSTVAANQPMAGDLLRLAASVCPNVPAVVESGEPNSIQESRRVP